MARNKATPKPYEFKGKDATKSVRQFINLDEIHNQRGNGKNAVIHVAQDDKSWDELQADTSLNVDVYDERLSEMTGGKRGSDRTTPLSEEQWSDLLDVAEIVEGESYDYIDRETGIIKTKTPEYLAYESDVLETPMGVHVDTESARAMSVPLDIEKHGDLTSAKINENSPHVQARLAVQARMDKIRGDVAKPTHDEQMTIEDDGLDL